MGRKQEKAFTWRREAAAAVSERKKLKKIDCNPLFVSQLEPADICML